MARTIFAQNPEKYIPALAEALKKIPEFEVPEWAMYVKSGPSRARPPVDEDFWFTRAASILRQLYIHGVVGVGKLRTRYGSKKDRGGKPDHFFKAGGKIIRVILQQAEAAGLVEKVLRMQHGRRLTQAGRDFLDSIDGAYDGDIDSSDWVVKNVLVVEQPIDEVTEENETEIEVEETEAPKGVPPAQVASDESDKVGKVAEEKVDVKELKKEKEDAE
ncbi:40S ribosomal protein S19 [archaeon]|jgi:small subunit ribosomal protein S19e|nr:40S ribosomal protein S19 [archaeon]MBT7128789.1 40S ribosomal protein S19 [archaeon]